MKSKYRISYDLHQAITTMSVSNLYISISSGGADNFKLLSQFTAGTTIVVPNPLLSLESQVVDEIEKTSNPTKEGIYWFVGSLMEQGFINFFVHIVQNHKAWYKYVLYNLDEFSGTFYNVTKR